ncbi:MAG: hypothetical protein ACE5NG_16715 [bacterium]
MAVFIPGFVQVLLNLEVIMEIWLLVVAFDARMKLDGISGLSWIKQLYAGHVVPQ